MRALGRIERRVVLQHASKTRQLSLSLLILLQAAAAVSSPLTTLSSEVATDVADLGGIKGPNDGAPTGPKRPEADSGEGTVEDDDGGEDEEGSQQQMESMPEDVRKAFAAAAEVGNLNAKIELPDHARLNKTHKFTRLWSITKFCNLSTDFESRQFRDELIVYEEMLNGFKQAWLKDPQAIVKDFEGAMKALDDINQWRSLLSAFDYANVYSYNSAEKKVNADGWHNFQKLRHCTTSTDAAIIDFENTVRSLPPEQLRGLMESPEGVRRRPWFRAICATHAVPLDQQIAAQSFAAAAANKFEELTSKLTLKWGDQDVPLHQLEELLSKVPVSELPARIKQLSDQFANSPLVAEIVKFLRWSAFDYALEPASLNNQRDRYALANILLGVDNKSAVAVRDAIETAAQPIWRRYIDIARRTQWILRGADDTQQLGLANLFHFPPVFKGFKKRTSPVNHTFETIEKAALDTISAFSPLLGKEAAKLKDETRVLWDKSIDPHFQQWGFRLRDGGRDAGPIVHIEMADKADDCFVSPAATVLAEGALCKLKNHDALVPPSKKWFDDALVGIMGREFAKFHPLLDMNEPGCQLQENIRVLFRGIHTLAFAHAMDKLEDHVHAACDALGDVKSVRIKGTRMPSKTALAEAWKKSLDWLEVPDQMEFGVMKEFMLSFCYEPKYETALGANRFDEKYLFRLFGDWRQTDLGSGVNMQIAPFLSMKRVAWKTVLRIMTEAAVYSAFHDDSGQLIPIAERETLIKKIITAPAQYTFGERINKVLGGEAEKSEYWTRVLQKCFNHHLDEAEKALDALQNDPDLGKMRQLLAALAQNGLTGVTDTPTADDGSGVAASTGGATPIPQGDSADGNIGKSD